MSALSKTLSFLILTLTAPCIARPIHPILLKTEKCVQVSKTTVEIARCHTDAQKDWHKELNSVYKKLTGTAENPETKAALKESQQAWEAFHKKESLFIAHYYERQGTVWVIVGAEMQANVVKDRVRELYKILESTNMAGNPNEEYRFDKDE